MGRGLRKASRRLCTGLSDVPMLEKQHRLPKGIMCIFTEKPVPGAWSALKKMFIV